MTEKRFIGSSGGFYDHYKNDRFAWSEWEEILQIMNNLNEKARERSKALSKLQKENEQLKNENKVLRIELDTHKHPLWSTREAERILKEKEEEIIELVDLLANEVMKNSNLLSENNDLRKKLMICEKRAKR